MVKQTVGRVIGGFAVLVLTVFAAAAAQQPAGSGAPGRQGGGGPVGARGALAAPPAPLHFREAWKQRPDGQQHPVTPDVVSNPSLELKLYGASAKEILVTGNHTGPPGIVWLFNGLSTTPIAVALRHKDSYVDLSGAAKIRWTIRTSGFHAARPVVKLADGTWLIGDRADVSLNYFNEIEFALATIRWLPLDIERIVTTGQSNGQWINSRTLRRSTKSGTQT